MHTALEQRGMGRAVRFIIIDTVPRPIPPGAALPHSLALLAPWSTVSSKIPEHTVAASVQTGAWGRSQSLRARLTGLHTHADPMPPDAVHRTMQGHSRNQWQAVSRDRQWQATRRVRGSSGTPTGTRFFIFQSALLCVCRERHMKTTAGDSAGFLMCAVTHRSQ